MSIKDLFNNSKSNEIAKAETIASASAGAEGASYIRAKAVEKEEFVPPLDFSTASNFAKYGSAELYYEYGFKRIYQQYPYDGTLAEKQAFENSGSFLDKYIFENLYPRTNGFVSFNEPVGGTAVDDGYYQGSTNKAYIRIYGDTHTASAGMTGKTLSSTFDLSTLYDTSKGRENNLKIDFTQIGRGATLEFWLKKDSFDITKGHREVLFDISDQDDTNPNRITLFLSASANTDPATPINAMNIVFSSGSGPTLVEKPLTLDTYATTAIADGNWHHYAVVLEKQASGIDATLYIDSQFHRKQNILSTIQKIDTRTKGIIATIGATCVSTIGDGQLHNASMDEFRFWKKPRTGEQIGKNWFVPIGGGTDDSDDNVDLGVYYKFNEGKTGNAEIDSIVLDYSGRLSNGKFVGYASSNRSTDSAIVQSGVAKSEFKDPIIYSTHPDVSTKMTQLMVTGSLHDLENPGLFYHLLPSWLIEKDNDTNKNIKYLCQIMASYFDTLHAQIAYFDKVKHIDYHGRKVVKDEYNNEVKTELDGNIKPLPFVKNLLRGRGFVIEDLFVDANIVEHFRQHDLNEVYDKDLSRVKNLIYQNLYNNLINIYKSKGTEKSFRNFFNAFGIDSDIVKLNLYADNATYTLKDNFEFKSTPTKTINFNHTGSFEASVYQNTGSGTNATGHYGYIRDFGGATQELGAYTLESEIIFPKKLQQGDVGFFPTGFLTSSLFGFHPIDASATNENEWFIGQTPIVVLLGSTTNREYSRFIVKAGATTILESEDIPNIYDNQKWNIALRVYHPKYNKTNIQGATSTPSNISVDLYAVCTNGNTVNKEISLTTTTSNSPSIMQANKKCFVGAYRTDFTGSVINKSDVKVSTFRYWESFLKDQEIKQHAFDNESYGLLHPYQSDHIELSEEKHVPKIETLALYWDFDHVTTSDSDGTFEVIDTSSGSLDQALASRYGYIGVKTKNKHHGKGFGFPASYSKVTDKVYINTAKRKGPSSIYSSDMITVKSGSTQYTFQDDEVSDNFYSFEKSMESVVSDEMLRMFASIKDFNNLIGNPVNRYRHSYKEMQKLKEIFFEKVENEPDREKFFEFYKWIDSSISKALEQLLPASTRFSKGIANTIESHALERNKYQHKFPLVSTKASTEGGIKGINELKYNWKYGHSARYLGQKAVGIITVSGNPGDNEVLSLVTFDGVTKTIKFNTANSVVTDTDTGASPTALSNNITLGIASSLGNNNNIAAAISIQINQYFGLSATAPANVISVVQPFPGPDGNKPIDSSAVSNMTSVNFQDGHDAENKHHIYQQRKEGDLADSIVINTSIRNLTRKDSHYLATSAGTRYLKVDQSSRLFSRGYNFSAIMTDVIHGGINYSHGKKRHFYREATAIHGQVNASGAPNNVLVTGVGSGQGTEAIDSYHEEKHPNKKLKYDLTAVIGNKSNFDGSHPLTDTFSYEFKLKGSRVYPFNLISGSISSGYNHILFSSYTANKPVLVNLHSDTVYDSNDVPMQGPFTETHVGGHQSRHQPINRKDSSKTGANNIDSNVSRAEAYRILVGEHPSEAIKDGALGMVGPDYGSPYPVDSYPLAIRFRDETAKRPVNIRNIRNNNSGSNSIAGNFNNNYEVVSSVSRTANNLRYRSMEPSTFIFKPTAFQVDSLKSTNVNGAMVARGVAKEGNVLLNTPLTQEFGTMRLDINSHTFGTRVIKFINHDSTTHTITAAALGGGNPSTATQINTDLIGNVEAASTQLLASVNLAITAGNLKMTVVADPSGMTLTNVVKGSIHNIEAIDTVASTLITNNNILVNTPDGAAQGFAGFTGGKSSSNLYFLDLKDIENPVESSLASNKTNKTIISERFSAPGGPETLTPIFMDTLAGERSAYNALPFRNLTVRSSGSGEADSMRVDTHNGKREGLQTLLSRPTTRYYADSRHQTIPDGYVQGDSFNSYSLTMNFHKQHRNNRLQPTETIVARSRKALRYGKNIVTPYPLKAYLEGEIVNSYPNLNTHFSNSLWFKVNETGTISRTLWGFQNPSTGMLVSHISLVNGDTIRFLVVRSIAENDYRIWSWDYDTTDPSNIGVWKHLALNWDGNFANAPVLYINALTLNDGNPIAGNTTSGTSWLSFERLHVLGTESEGTIYPSGCSIAELSFWKGEITQATANALYNNGNFYDMSSAGGDLLDYWQLGEDLPLFTSGSFVTKGTNIPATYGTKNTILTVQNNVVVDAGLFEGGTSGASYRQYKTINDNAFTTTQIPATDYQYRWISDNTKVGGFSKPGTDIWTTGQQTNRYESKTGLIQSGSNYISPISFPTISQFEF